MLARGGFSRKRVLVVNASFDTFRTYRPRRLFLTRATAPLYLAGAFNPRLCDVRIHCEVTSGVLCRECDFAWPDLLVLTGTTNSLDRMRQVTAYARSKNPSVVIVAGGPAVRALPSVARAYFDYACEGDLEEIEEVIADVFGSDHVAKGLVPRFDLAARLNGLGFIETTRNCNFACSFCSLTAEARPYKAYDPAFIRAQFEALGPRKYICLQDNNFYGNNRASFLDRIAILKEYHERKYFKGWVALVTADFFANEDNLFRVKEAGCVGLFSGVESLQPEMLGRYAKKQNLYADRFAIARKCIDAGIVFDYGLIFDPAHQTIASFRDDIADILAQDDITAPGFLSLTIPLLGTPFFREVAREGAFLPNVRLRDMDGNTLVVWPQDPINEVGTYLRHMNSLREHWGSLVGHVARFAWRRRRDLRFDQLAVSILKPLHRAFYDTSPWRNPRRSAVATTEPLDPLFMPAFRIASRYVDHFKPTMVTDRSGAVMLEEAFGAHRKRQRLSPCA
jgi:hypothetical protein